MSKRIFDENTVMTALCLWEAWLDIEVAGFAKKEKGEDPGDTYTVLEELRGNHGSYCCRQLMMDIADDCDKAWEAHEALSGDNHSDFDFEFCPDFLSGAAASGLLDDKMRRQYMSAAELEKELQAVA